MCLRRSSRTCWHMWWVFMTDSRKGFCCFRNRFRLRTILLVAFFFCGCPDGIRCWVVISLMRMPRRWRILRARFVVSSICLVIAREQTPGIIFSEVTSRLLVVFMGGFTIGTWLARLVSRQMSLRRVKNAWEVSLTYRQHHLQCGG